MPSPKMTHAFGHHPRSLWIGAMCGLLFLCTSLNAWGFDHLKDARQALAAGDLERMERSLNAFEKQLKDPKKKYKQQTKDNGELWLHLLWSQYHQLKGAPPAFVRLRQFETKKQVKEQLDAMERSAPHLQSAIGHLRQYNIAFRRVMNRASTNDALTLVNITSRIGILQNSHRAVLNRIPHLQTLLRQWDQETPAQRKIRMQMLIQLAKKNQSSLRKLQKEQSSRQKEQSKAVAKAQQLLKQHNQKLDVRNKKGLALFHSGLVVSAVGVAGFSVAIGLFIRKEDPNCDHECVQRLEEGVPISLVAAGTVLAVGVTLIVVGLAIRPTNSQRYKGVYKSHKQYLDWDKESADKQQTSLAPPPPASGVQTMWAGSL